MTERQHTHMNGEGKGGGGERERAREKENAPIHCFTLQMPAMTDAGPGLVQGWAGAEAWKGSAARSPQLLERHHCCGRELGIEP